MHPIFITNPDMLEFCETTGIFNQINFWLESGLNENYNKAVDLIQITELSKTVMIGNGDVIDYEDGLQKATDSGVDGIMIGRGIFKNPWVFLPRDRQKALDNRENRLKLLLDHLQLWQKTWGDIKTLKKQPDFVPNLPENINLKNFASMKKFVKMYISNFDGALDLRVRFMNLNTCPEMIELCLMELN